MRGERGMMNAERGMKREERGSHAFLTQRRRDAEQCQIQPDYMNSLRLCKTKPAQ